MPKSKPYLKHRTDEGKELLSKFLAQSYKHGLQPGRQDKEELEIQKLADKIYEQNFGAKCPYRFYLASGYTDHLFQSIILPGFDVKKFPEDLNTLCHELLHVAKGHSLPHGKRFEDKVKAMVKQAKELLK